MWNSVREAPEPNPLINCKSVWEITPDFLLTKTLTGIAYSDRKANIAKIPFRSRVIQILFKLLVPALVRRSEALN